MSVKLADALMTLGSFVGMGTLAEAVEEARLPASVAAPELALPIWPFVVTVTVVPTGGVAAGGRGRFHAGDRGDAQRWSIRQRRNGRLSDDRRQHPGEADGRGVRERLDADPAGAPEPTEGIPRSAPPRVDRAAASRDRGCHQPHR